MLPSDPRNSLGRARAPPRGTPGTRVSLGRGAGGAGSGATRFVPGSHRWGTGRTATEEETTAAVMPAGSVLIYVGNLVHGGGANHTDRPRLGVILEYAASWLRPQENHVLAVPQEVVRELPERLQELLGYNIHPPFLGYVDGRHPRRVLQP